MISTGLLFVISAALTAAAAGAISDPNARNEQQHPNRPNQV
jgi:hypothetical protein